ncbi:hypothetical protein [Agrobacterium tumefaciens]|uniref:hypothetical protein n=1 Tax=Agrobacterium tumefaciens TaxID=358 RepID=UPI0026BE50E4
MEQRDGHPAKVDVPGDGGIHRIDFGEPEDGLTQIARDEFFEIFEDRKLAFFISIKRRARRAVATSSFRVEGRGE